MAQNDTSKNGNGGNLGFEADLFKTADKLRGNMEPSGETAPVRPWDVAPTSIQLALARGHRWLAMLESGEAKSLKEIATREGIDNSYVSRMVNLTTLAPDIVAAILDDTLPNHITLFDLAVDPPALWDEQRARVGL